MQASIPTLKFGPAMPRLAGNDLAAIRRHLAYLAAERAALSLNATLPSGFRVTVARDGLVSRA